MSTMTETLNLSKDEKVDITKGNPGLAKIALACGWSFATNPFDLDIFAILLNSNGKRAGNDLDSSVVYFRNRNLKGFQLSEDNRTGAGDGDDETMIVNLADVPAEVDSTNLYINIYNAGSKTFSQVKDAYVRCYDPTDATQKNDTKKGMFRFDLNEDGGRNTGLFIGRIYRHNGEWKFESKGEFVAGDINSIAAQYVA